mgnify:CR=1 FL=1
MANTEGAYTVLTTLTLQKQGGTGTLAVRRLRDGSVEFTQANGEKCRILNQNNATKLFEALEALA